jgi:predicted dehydrogenase
MRRIMGSVQKVRWGVLGAAAIATKKVIPAMQRGTWSAVAAIASRDLPKAQQAAASLGISRAYGSYEELLGDRDVDAVYIPLPNHLHAHWAVRAAEAGKHVLCEKPIALNMEEAERLLAVCYFNDDPSNIRNMVSSGGGGLMDIGCYLVTTARLLFEKEPTRVFAAIERDRLMGTDRLASMTLDFGSGHAIGTCSTQLVPHQRVQILGTRGRLEIEIPFNAPPDRPCVLNVDDGSDLFGGGIERIEFAACDQYTIQGDLFSRAVREGLEPAVPLEDSVRNMSVIDALFRSGESGAWEAPRAILAQTPLRA